MKLVLNPEFNLYEKDSQAFCDSLQIAETFGKEHKEILKNIAGEKRNGIHINGLIDDMIQSGVNTPDYFIKVTYKDSRNRTQPKYLLSRDGFTLTAMGFTGSKAFKFKIDYINRFNQMEQFIKSLLTTKIEFPAFTEAVMLAHDEPKHYHFSNEINMIYRIVLGVDAKKYRVLNGIKSSVVIKPFLTLPEIKAIEALQRVDIGLFEVGLDYEQRKDILTKRYQRTRLKITA